MILNFLNCILHILFQLKNLYKSLCTTRWRKKIKPTYYQKLNNHYKCNMNSMMTFLALALLIAVANAFSAMPHRAVKTSIVSYKFFFFCPNAEKYRPLYYQMNFSFLLYAHNFCLYFVFFLHFRHFIVVNLSIFI